MKDKLINLIKKEVVAREKIPFYIQSLDNYGGLNLKFEFEDGEPHIDVIERTRYIRSKKFFLGFIPYESSKQNGTEVRIECNGLDDVILTDEEVKDLRDFVFDEMENKTKKKIEDRLKKYEE